MRDGASNGIFGLLCGRRLSLLLARGHVKNSERILVWFVTDRTGHRENEQVGLVHLD